MNILYARKSTESEERQVLSIESQVNELSTLAEREGFKIDQIFTESKSAKSPGRPEFNQMLQLISQRRDCTLFVWKLDRLARNPIDGGQIIWLLQQGIIKEIKTNERSYFPADNVLLMYFELGMANQFVRDLSNNVKRGNKTKLEKGGWPGIAPIGYLNDKTNQTIVIDPDKSKYIVKIFELFATGAYSTKDISRILYNEGLRTKGGKKIYDSIIYRTLNNPFYMGLMLRQGKLYQGTHTPLISKTLFDTCQEIFSPNRSRKQKHLFPVRGFVHCAICGCAYTASTKKGHVYYYCTNGKGICEEHRQYLKARELYDVVAEIFETVKFDEEAIEIQYLAAKEKLQSKETYKQASSQTVLKELDLLSEKRKRLEDTYLDGTMAKDRYNARILELDNEEIALKNQLKQIEQLEGYATLEQTKKAFLTAATAQKDFLNGDDIEKHELAKNLLWNVSIRDKKVQCFQLKQPYQLMAEAPKNDDFSNWQGV